MKKSTILFLILTLASMSSCSQTKILDREAQIASAVLAGPEDERAEATVYGFDSKGQEVLIREGTNNLICRSDDPGKDGYECVCYHKDLQPFMERGKALRAEGMSFKEVFDQREKEAKAGTLKMPDQGATLHILSGPDGSYDVASGKVLHANYRSVVYIPWATAESTGLPLKPLVPGGPWIMDPGTHRAHIMITPPQKE